MAKKQIESDQQIQTEQPEVVTIEYLKSKIDELRIKITQEVDNTIKEKLIFELSDYEKQEYIQRTEENK